MNKLRVKCMRCGKEWEKDSEISWGPDDISSSLCNACFKKAISPIIHRKQLREGNFNCFGTAGAYCDQSECKYMQWCLRMGEVEKAGKKDKKQSRIRAGARR